MNIDDTVIGLIRNDPNFTFHKECDNTNLSLIWQFDDDSRIRRMPFAETLWRRIYIDVLHVIMNDADFPEFRDT